MPSKLPHKIREPLSEILKTLDMSRAGLHIVSENDVSRVITVTAKKLGLTIRVEEGPLTAFALEALGYLPDFMQFDGDDDDK